MKFQPGFRGINGFRMLITALKKKQWKCVKEMLKIESNKSLHIGGPKPNSRRRAEMKGETGKTPGRGQLYLATRRNQDGSYVNEAAKEICENIELAMTQRITDESEVSPNDVVGKVLGTESILDE